MADISVQVGLDQKFLKNQVNKAGQTIKGNLTSILGVAGAVQGLKSTFNFLKDSVSMWDTQAKAIAQVRQGIISTGNAAGLSLKKLEKTASELQENSLFGDEAILEGVTSQLLSFTNIAGDEFLRTQQAVLDVTTRLKGANASMGDLRSIAIQIGKALNDPVKGLSALGKSGIQFTDSQKKVINSLVKTGNQAEAQRMILSELERQYKDSAKAAAESGSGPLVQLANSLGDIQEVIGEGILPAVKQFASTFKTYLPDLADLGKDFGESVGDGLKALTGEFETIKSVVSFAITPFQDMFSIVKSISGIFGESTDTVSAFSSIIKVLSVTTRIAFLPIIALTKLVKLAVDGIAQAFHWLSENSSVFRNVWETAVIQPIALALDGLEKLGKWLGIISDKVKAGGSGVFSGVLKGGVENVLSQTTVTGTGVASSSSISGGGSSGDSSDESITGGANKQIIINVDKQIETVNISSLEDPRKVKNMLQAALNQLIADVDL